MKKKIIFKTIILILFVLVIAGCKKNTTVREGDYEDGVIITDVAERCVKVPKKVSKIVSLMKECTSVVATLDALDMLVGLDSTSMSYFVYQQAFLNEKIIQDVGATKEPNIELIASLKPDIILTWAGYGADLADQIQEKTGIPVIALHTLTTIKGMEDNYNIVAKLIHKEKRAEELFNYASEKIEMVKKLVSGIPENERPKAHLLFWGFWNGVTRIPIYYDTVEIAGGINIAKGSNAAVYGYSVKVPVEQVVVWNPDVILIHGSPKNPMVRIETVTSDVRIKDVNAIKNKRVYYTPGMSSGWHYPRVLTEMIYMARWFYPDRFQNIDPILEGDEIYEKFYHVDGLWSQYGKYEGYIE